MSSTKIIYVFFVPPFISFQFSSLPGTELLPLGRPSPHETTAGPCPESDESRALPHHISLR